MEEPLLPLRIPVGARRQVRLPRPRPLQEQMRAGVRVVARVPDLAAVQALRLKNRTASSARSSE